MFRLAKYIWCFANLWAIWSLEGQYLILIFARYEEMKIGVWRLEFCYFVWGGASHHTAKVLLCVTVKTQNLEVQFKCKSQSRHKYT